jgi:hypothetical protein
MWPHLRTIVRLLAEYDITLARKECRRIARASRFHDLAVEMDYVSASSPLVKVIYVLSNDRYFEDLLQFAEREMR